MLREIVDKADREAVEGFGSAVKQAGKSAADGKGMWQDSEFADLVQYNDGFRTGLIGTPEQIAERIVAYKTRGVNLLLLGFLHYLEDVEYFGTGSCRWSVSSKPISPPAASSNPNSPATASSSTPESRIPHRKFHIQMTATITADQQTRFADALRRADLVAAELRHRRRTRPGQCRPRRRDRTPP